MSILLLFVAFAGGFILNEILTPINWPDEDDLEDEY